MNPPRRELGWPLAGLFAASVVAWLVAANHLNQISDRSVHGPHWYLGLALGALLIACGAVVWRRRPDTPIGIRMVIAGFLVFAEVLLRSNDSWLFTVGDLLAGASAALFAHIVLTYPSGRCETPLEKVMVTSGYVTVGALCIARATTTNFGPTCPDCPVNRLYIGGYPRLFNAVNGWSAVLVAAFAVGATAALLAKWRRAGPAGRRVLAPTYASALLVLATLLIVRPHLDTRSPRPGDDALDWATLTLPVALAFGLLRGHLARAAASDLLVDLRDDGDLQAAARRALADPSSILLTWDEGAATFRRDDGTAYGGLGGTHRRLTIIERDGRRLAALEHDDALGDEPERLSAVLSAVGLALDRARLARAVQDQLAEVASSRARIVAAADEERRRIERNLHDGAQQRLVGASMLLRRARSRALADHDDDLARLLLQASTEVDDGLREIRELARGLLPPMLAERGLVAALDSLAESAPIPTEIDGRLTGRLAPATEAAAFFVASECLANAAKHSGATGVVITVGTVDDRVVLQVADNGHGGAALVDGHGLYGLRDRVEAVDGSLDVESGASGTTVTVRLPSRA